MEFLGDAVLDAVVNEIVMEKYPTDDPGELTLKKTSCVSNKALCLVSLYYGLDSLLFSNIQDYKKCT